MDKKYIEEILNKVQSNKLGVNDALDKLKKLPYEELGFAKIDTHRAMRNGFPEVIFCQGKTVSQVQEIVLRMKEYNSIILGMRASEDIFNGVKSVTDGVEYFSDARAILIGEFPKVKYSGTILVVSAGTADMPVAEEAALTSIVLGNKVEKLYDAGIAGIHRLLYNSEKIISANVIVAVAGMEGALPGVVGSLVDKPVIAVPTSVGYGANFQGLSALLTMLNSCVSGIAVVNIDNGFGAGFMAASINRLSGKLKL
ncbi:nickel pincer cofactor biosynthesis protein LarB [Bacteroidota bacterium]